MSDHQPANTSAQKQLWALATGHHYLTYLLASLMFVLFVVPIAESVPFAAGLLRLGITAVLVSAAFAIEHRRTLVVFGFLVVVIAAPTTWATMFVDHPYLFLFSCVLESLVFVAVAIMILTSVIRKHLATVHSIFGAISAYPLLGLAWAVLYWGLHHVDKTALDVGTRRVGASVERSSAEVSAFSQFIYFSFVTMSTLGYGDIVPQKPLAQTLAWMQSVTGQFYLAALVAWIVSEIPRRHKHEVP